MRINESVCEREIERERECGEIEREIEIQTDRQTDREKVCVCVCVSVLKAETGREREKPFIFIFISLKSSRRSVFFRFQVHYIRHSRRGSKSQQNKVFLFTSVLTKTFQPFIITLFCFLCLYIWV